MTRPEALLVATLVFFAAYGAFGCALRLARPRWATRAKTGGLLRRWLPRRGGRRHTGPQWAELLLLDLAAQLRAGATLPQALRALADDADPRLGPAAAAAAVRAERGDWSGALGELARSLGAPAAELSAALEVQRLTGGDLAPVVDRVAAAVREREVRRAEIRARTAEARWSAAVMALSPLAMALYVTAFHPELWSALLRQRAGWGALGYALASWLAGLLWIRRALRLAGAGADEP